MSDSTVEKVNESVNERERIDKVVAAIKVVGVKDKVYVIDAHGNMSGYNTLQAHAYIRAVHIEIHGSSPNKELLREIADELVLKAIYEEQCNKGKPDRLAMASPEVTSSVDGIAMAMVVIASILGVLAIVWSNTGGI